MSPGLEGLFEPLEIRHMRLRNRFVVPSMQRGVSDDGAPTTALAEYYGRFAEGGFALVMSESCAIDHPSASRKTSCVRLNATTVDAWRRCVRQVRQAGAHMLIQLWHEGALRAVTGGGVHPDAPTLSPSGLARACQPTGDSMSAADLREIKLSYVRSALLAQDAGASGVELHAGHGFLLDQFLWAETNRRDDGYGGDSMEHRARFPAEVVAAVREATGEDFVISLRFSQWKGNHGRKLDKLPEQQTRVARSPDELGVMLRILRRAGVDMFHVSARHFDRPEWDHSQRSLAAWTKKLIDAPVIAVGSVGTELNAEQTLYEGLDADRARKDEILAQSLGLVARQFAADAFDLIAVGRSSIGDQQWVKKVLAGNIEKVELFDRKMLASIVRDIR